MNDIRPMGRAEAKARGMTHYFTGVPCKNGHTALRYTQSCACIECLKDHNAPVIRPSTQEKAEAIDQLILMSTRVFDQDVKKVTDAMWAFAVMRYPCLEPNDILSKSKPTKRDGRIALYSFFVHPDDFNEALKLVIDIFNKTNNFDARAALDQIYGKLGINNHSSIQTGQHLPPVRLERLDAPADPEQARQQSLKNYPGGVDPEEARRLAWEKWETFNKNHAATNKPGGDHPRQP